MAKISANGATEVGRITTRPVHKADGNPGVEKVYVMCSDGRVLTRWTGDTDTGYHVRTRGVASANRDVQYLIAVAWRDGYERIR